MSKSGQYVIEQQTKAYEKGEPDKDFSNLRDDEVEELDEWLAMVHKQMVEDDEDIR